MNTDTLHIILIIGAYILVGMFGVWLCLQLIMWVLSLNIERILRVRNQTACNYLRNGKFWKKNNNRYVWFLKGPGMVLLVKKVLGMAKQEIWENNFKSNSTLYGQCSVCIFTFDCYQKYVIHCNHCIIYNNCSLLKQKRKTSICKQFRCIKWIEND